MFDPYDVFVDSGKRLWVRDNHNNRVIRLENAADKDPGENADDILGQLNFTSNTSATTQKGIYSSAGLFVDLSGSM